MSRIRELTHEEAAQLREGVRTRYLMQKTNGNSFKPSSFKGAYEDICDDIKRKVPDKQASVSTTRLRKLFYYTDPTVCLPDKLEKPSFGRDFIEALEQYAQEEESPVVPPKRRLNAWAIGFTLLVLLIIVSYIVPYFQPKSPKSWRENFYDTSVEGLRAHGFGWQNFDSVWWSKQLRQGSLTLYTLAGDYWVKPGEPKIIRNMIYKKISGDCFTIIVKVDDFDPQQNCQQLTVFLFDERASRETHLRAGISYWSSPIDSLGVQHTTTDYQENGQVTQMGYYHFRNPANAGPPMKTFWLKIVYKDNKVAVFQKINDDWNMWGICAHPFDLRFKPAYVGLAAFHGWTENDHTPRNADSIPVFVDYLQVESCD